MQIASWLFVTSTLVSPAPSTAPSHSPALQPATSSVAADADQRLPISPTGATTPAQAPAPHRFGVGGTFTMSNRGAGAGVRYWFNQHVGTSTQVSWFRSGFRTSGTTSSSANFVQALSTVTYLFREADAGSVANLRPYVGAGALYVRGSTRFGSATARASGAGPVAFGGVELTFQEYPGLSISNEVIYTGLPDAFSGSRDRVVYQMSIHFYLR
jgi:hypothetical protein